ncbi:phosphoribosylamine--glycine ligase [Anaerosphaera aminiphila DSM 21120]|uniref:Phosphoribosylamine--glycine ligase n=1 Tax=Anaerosphaera aminiphila DSM 21120 TaxID=1120995 RepID=A0A1M5RWR7_9FIRM|nr:phosphoribosylformylglycinamidine synthase [Anaerosphaera aminiphila]SHH30630.1 phosphoribosylamine--glycine ligase [Anaerosphaera aminiphila DSM 21120]
MKILIIGSGGREYAIAYNILKSVSNREIYFAPGNGGTEELGKNVNIAADDVDALLNFAISEKIDYTIVGPEVPLCMGIADKFESKGLKIFGPKLEGAMFEKSKAFTKDFLKKYNIKTADYLESENYDEAFNFAKDLFEKSGRVVIKADGLAAGKGVLIAESEEEIVEFLKDVIEVGKYGDKKVVVEEFLDGFEMSLICLCDTETILPLPTSRDHKKIGSGEVGLNTGGMGTYAPNAEADAFLDDIKAEILNPILEGFKSEKIDYRGALFIGLMITDEGINVLEFNARFGDPETQSILELIDNDILELLTKTSERRLKEVKLKTNNKKALCLVLSAGGYPENYEKGSEITIANDLKAKVFHAGTKLENGKLVTNGGRVLNIVYSSENFDNTIETVYKDVKKVNFKDMYYRTDIGPGVKRVFVRKKDEFAYESRELVEEIKNALGINLKNINIYNRYDIEIKDSTLEEILYTILSEKPIDDIYYGESALKLQSKIKDSIVVSYLPGQFDQREQGLLDTIALVSDEEVKASSSRVYEIEGATREEIEKIESFLVNPVDSHRINLLGIPTTLKSHAKANRKNRTYTGFIKLDKNGLNKFIEDHGLAMSYEDIEIVRDYFKSENRDPNETEISIIDTYWSDHCRHTTFNTELNIEFNEKTELDKMIKESFDRYLAIREELNITKPISLMSFGTILSKYFREKGELEDLEISSEINACSVKVKVRVFNGDKEELRDYLLMFKNETHNHPTEIEPFGGASTCLGGAIRDPLSGRSFVYQAMRITGAADPRTPISETLAGKLPQKKITTEAAAGYSSYGNQIGLPTGYLDEIYHEGYVAKRMEAGAVMAAAPIENVKRLDPVNGDLVLLLGGRTGRDGIGGATGSSKAHKKSSIETESAQVQKGNATEERKIQRLFRREEAAKLIKKCNDFGAGGVSVAIGELSDGVEIYLDRVPLKYEGLSPREIAISESQERMALVIDPKDLDEFNKYCDEENLKATVVAKITDKNRMLMKFDDTVICDMSYDFINTNGARRTQDVVVTSEDVPSILKDENLDPKSLKEHLSDLNTTSKKNLIELFDPSVGRNTVLNPLGGKERLNPIQTMVAKIPSFEKDVRTVSLMSYGFDPYISEKSQYLGGYYAVIESIVKIAATGAPIDKIRLSFQEFYERLRDEKIWSKPLKSLLGALEASEFFNAPPVGGKDSMSGSFEELNVPPTLISFAVTTSDIESIISPDFKGKGKIGLIKTPMNKLGMLDLNKLKENLNKLKVEIDSKNIISATAITARGTLPQIYEAAIGNTGFNIKLDDLYSPLYGSFIVEYLEPRDFIEEAGKFSDEIVVNGVKLDESELRTAYLHTLDGIFKPVEEIKLVDRENNKVSPRRTKSKKTVEKPLVVIPAFPGTNCEWDTKDAFENYGAIGEIFLFKNRDNEDIKNSKKEFADLIRKSQILVLPGGFSLGDEPDGSGKFIANVLRAKEVSEAIDYMLEENDGLILGICNGFQALIKTGLLPSGKVKEVSAEDPTLTFNTCRRHIAKFVDTKLKTNNSPWLSGLEVGKTYTMPISHGEGRVVASEEAYEELLENDQIVSVYEVSPNGSDYNIESIMSKDGKILGKMGHAERIGENLFKNIYDVELQNIFKSGVDYFKK